MMIDLNILKNEINNEKNIKKIIEIKNVFTKKYLTPLYAQLKTVDNKKEFGLKVNSLKNEIETIIDERITNINEANDISSNDSIVNIDIDTQIIKQGSRHLLNTVIEEIISFFKKLNFDIAYGDELVNVIYNFDNLNISKKHVAYDSSDTFFIDPVHVLRTHCTATTAAKIKDNKNKDIRILSYGNVYRKDEDDSTHSHQFMQIDFVWIRENLSLANLKWLINELIKYLFGNDLQTRYRLSHFPFTEPSFEVDVECWNCKTIGCNICKQTGWIEILGAGMLNQQVIKKANIKNITTGLASGIGVERIAMLKYKVSDIRDFYNNDFDVLKQYKK